jgi:hypothetical protein
MLRVSRWERLVDRILEQRPIFRDETRSQVRPDGRSNKIRTIEFLAANGATMRLVLTIRPKLIEHRVIAPRKRPQSSVETFKYSETETIETRELFVMEGVRWQRVDPLLLDI